MVIYQVDENYPPFTYTNQKYIYGFDPDFTNLIFNSAEYRINFSSDSWTNVYNRMLKGEVDVAGIIAVTEERKNEVLFTNTLFNSYISIYALADTNKVGLEDLSKLKVGVGKGYYSESILKNELGITDYITYEDLSQAIDDLEAGTLDVIFENQILMDNLLVATRYKGAVIAHKKNLYPLPHAYAISKDRPDLVEYMNNRISQLQSNGVFEELYTKYFYSHSEYYETSRKMKSITILGVIAFFVGVAFLLLRMYIVFLKKKLAVNYVNLWNAKEEIASANEELQAQFEEIQAQVEEINQSKTELKKSEERYRLVTEGSNDGLWDWDIVEDTLFLSDRWSHLLGYQSSYINKFTSTWMKGILDEDQSVISENFINCKTNIKDHLETEFRIISEDNRILWLSIRAKIMYDQNGNPVRMAGSITDISERKNYENRIYQMAYYDYLTNIPNRLLLNERLEEILKNTSVSNKLTAVLYIDLDNFKHINDSLGHDIGDQLLKWISKDLTETLHSKSFIARIGGDEFILLIEKLSKKQEAYHWADYVLKLLNKNWIVSGHEIYVSASIGITIIPEDGTDYKKILKNADTAMYAAKADGRGRYKFFNEEMLSKVTKRAEIENSLRKAIENKEFILYYQPYINIYTGSIVGLEALIRWYHPVKGMISPAEFIPLAEETGLIKEIGQWVIREACQQCKKWQEEGLHAVPIAVNVSEIQLEDNSFEAELVKIIQEEQINPAFLQIEITESVIVKSMGRCIEQLNRIRALGIKVSLDDFGTGYSSLHYIQLLPLDVIKIDKSFIDQVSKRAYDSLIIGDIISIAHKLKMNVVAEGVETEKQYEYLRNESCDMIQGYLFYKPLPQNEVEKLLLSV